jgi:hypothetical protein
MINCRRSTMHSVPLRKISEAVLESGWPGSQAGTVKESLEVHTKAICICYASASIVGAQPCSIFSTERTSAFEMKYIVKTLR